MDISGFNEQLRNFLINSPTPFHAASSMSAILATQGFTRLNEGDSWQLEPGRYFVTRNDSSIIAFVLGTEAIEETGIRLVGAHTDSPCLKVKPVPEKDKFGYHQLGVEVYGGVLLNPWFDRDLSLAGRITTRDSDGKIRNRLVNLQKPIAVIPSLAIHLDREANNSRSVNAENDIAPVLLQQEEARTLEDLLVAELEGEELLATDLVFYDTNPARFIGVNEEFLASARLDNLLSCFTGLMSLIDADDSLTSLLVCNDHEEVGSVSAAGAEGTFLKDVLMRITPDQEQRLRAFNRSLLISTDNAHGVHPNYPTRHEANHGPILNKGPAIKYNANQRYATNSETAGFFKALCRDENVPCQEFVNRADMACGSTIGPITATELGIRTLDVGVPTFAMHSIRELAGSQDAHALGRVLTRFYGTRSLLV
ncbi:MAG: M18 family aminopeptidase [Pseudomonadales bacterium]|jgi:aspartyl aminopeptidase|nr:M18 family aminopeptidase [Pseudomonadales bacterium]